MHKTLLRVALVAFLFSPLTVLLPNVALADTVQVNFENPPYTVGTINGQDGWMKTGSFDANVAATSVANFGAQSLQISDAVTSGSFGDQTFAKPLTNAVGETGATAGSFSAGTLQSHFEMQFDIAAVAPHSTDVMSVSPDRGDGSRMSYLRFEDLADGIHVHFDDVIDAGPLGTVATFNDYDIATLNASIPHTIKLTLDTVNGPHNDVVKVYIDGALIKTGTSWEDYYRYDPEASAEQSPRIVKTVLFRESATANPADAGKGYLIDNLTLTSGPAPVTSTVVVTPSNTHSWTTDDTRTGGAVNFITDATTPAGNGALQLTTDNTTTSKAQYMQYTNGVPTLLSSVTELSYYTKQNSASFAGGDASYQLPVFINGTTGFNTFVFEPYENGTVVPGTWQHWDVTKGQFWSTHTFTCSGGTITAGSGGAPFYTLSQIETICPNTTVIGFGVNVGSNNPSYNVETDLVSFNGTAYDFEPAPPAPTTETVTILKYIDGQHATAANANNALFPFTANYQASNIAGGAAGSDPFTIGATGNNVSTGNPYEVKTIPLATGASYSAVENVTDNNVVGASCTDGKPFALAGYSSGNTFAEAFAAASSSTIAPAFTGLTSDKVVIVWNKTCPVAPPQVHIFKYVNNVQATAANNTATFPMNASWVSTTLGTVPSVGYTLSPTPWGPTDTAYEASYVGGAAGDNYATNEVTGGPVVGASCADGKPFALAGYSTGDTLAQAFTNASSTASPSFINLQSDKYVIVWNKTCPAITNTASISGHKFEDWDGDSSPFETQWEVGLKGWTIYLDMNNNGVLDSGDISTTTGKNGVYSFANLPAGTYTVREVQQAGWTQTFPSTNAANDKYVLTLATGQKMTKKDFGNFKLGSISGIKFEDKNGNHKHDAGEPTLSGWTINIKGPNGYASSMVTDANGAYSFTGLKAGIYKLSEVMKAGWKQTDHPGAVKITSDKNAKNKNFGNKQITTGNKTVDKDDGKNVEDNDN